jgi:hypothetical protein
MTIRDTGDIGPFATDHRERADLFRAIIRSLQECVYRLDALQVGDLENEVSPIKHQLSEALAAPCMAIAHLATTEYDRSERERKA